MNTPVKSDEIKRYDHMGFEQEYGVWVRWVDYDALAQSTTAQVWAHLQTENHSLKQQRDALAKALERSDALLKRLHDGGHLSQTTNGLYAEFQNAREYNNAAIKAAKCEKHE